MSISHPILSEFLTKEELAIELRRNPRTLDRWEILGMGPPRTVIGRKVIHLLPNSEIPFEDRDIRRLAKHFDVSFEEAKKRYTKIGWGERVLRHRKDKIYATVCQFLDNETRRCSIYNARPTVCREYPEERRCGYYTFLAWERKHQDDPEFVPLLGGRSF